MNIEDVLTQATPDNAPVERRVEFQCDWHLTPKTCIKKGERGNIVVARKHAVDVRVDGRRNAIREVPYNILFTVDYSSS